jgi:hypothetical protein
MIHLPLLIHCYCVHNSEDLGTCLSRQGRFNEGATAFFVAEVSISNSCYGPSIAAEVVSIRISFLRCLAVYAAVHRV